MPTYDYVCSECGYEFERILHIENKDVPLSEPCPKCGKSNCITQILAGAPAIGDPIRMGIRRPSAAFQSRLKNIMKRAKGSKQSSRYGHNLTEI